MQQQEDESVLPNPFMGEALDPANLPEVKAFDREAAIAAGEKLARETAVLELHIRKPGFRKPIAPAEFIQKIRQTAKDELTPEQLNLLAQWEAQQAQPEGPNPATDVTMLHVSQDIIDRKEIANIAYQDNRFIDWIKSPLQSIPSPMLAPGMYQVRLKDITRLDEAITTFMDLRSKRVDGLGVKYEQLVADAKVRRGPFFTLADYPPWPIVRSKYTVDARYLTYNVPAAIEGFNARIAERERQKFQLEWADAAQLARDAQRFTLLELVGSFTEMLGKDDATGKRKTFRPTAVNKLLEYVKIFDDLNLTNDQELGQLVAAARDILKGVDPASLKKDLTLRDAMAQKVGELKVQAAQLVQVQQRKVIFEEDEGVLSLDA